ncbi:uncharacterized protein CEXT_46591 [Caerostris extrusa]|uniref:Uncharacterized protein n=1 Tax=Caerostris extrusa TaxID=172846 RepID=A0AAV4Q3F4_CAEEX|nr:uncharacterized protein CEXT_46591 [Caerostris extrusa]
MAVIRSLHVAPNTRATIPIHAYINNIWQAPNTIQWLDFIAYYEGIVILYALSGFGEEKLDVFLQTRIVLRRIIFIHIHGNCQGQTDNTTAVLRSQGFHVDELWEQEFTGRRTRILNFKTFFESNSIENRLNPRDGIFGGLTKDKLFSNGYM